MEEKPEWLNMPQLSDDLKAFLGKLSGEYKLRIREGLDGCATIEIDKSFFDVKNLEVVVGRDGIRIVNAVVCRCITGW
jgi:hypothetical protein